MSTLDEIKGRDEELRRTNTRELVSKITEYGEEYTLLTKIEADHRRLIAALEAVGKLAESWHDAYIFSASEFNDIRDDAAYEIEAAIAEALA